MTARKTSSPSKEAAAHYLRDLAWTLQNAPPPPIPAGTARALSLIADCIEGKARWSRGHAFPTRWRKQIWFRATFVDKAPRGEKEAVLAMHASELARQMGLTGRDDVEKVRDSIAAMVKTIRATNRKKDRG